MSSIKQDQCETGKEDSNNEVNTYRSNRRFKIKNISAARPKRREILPPIDTAFKLKTQLDLDPEFYSMVEGRPIKQNKSIRLYKENIRNIMVSGVTRGFILDEILRIKQEMETERVAYDVASRHFAEYKNSFEQFLAHDNSTTMDVIKKCDVTAKELACTNEEHKKLCFEMATLKSKLQYTDESRIILISYEKFLHQISPLWWQLENHISDYDRSEKEVIVITRDVFCEMNPAEIEKQLLGRLPPINFFESPYQLLMAFEMLEEQNLNYLLITEEMNADLMMVQRGTENVKNTWKKEISFIRDQINAIECVINLNTSREEELKEIFFKILKETLEETIASETALKLHFHVQYVYEKIITTNDINDTAIEMVHTLEREYNDIIFELYSLDLDIVKEIEKVTFSEDVKVMDEAKNAKNLLKNFEKIRKRLGAAYDPYERANI